MRIKEIKGRTTKELNDLLSDLRKKLSQAQFELSLGKLKQVNLIGAFRKDIARVLTVLSSDVTRK